MITLTFARKPFGRCPRGMEEHLSIDLLRDQCQSPAKLCQRQGRGSCVVHRYSAAGQLQRAIAHSNSVCGGVASGCGVRACSMCREHQLVVVKVKGIGSRAMSTVHFEGSTAVDTVVATCIGRAGIIYHSSTAGDREDGGDITVCQLFVQ